MQIYHPHPVPRTGIMPTYTYITAHSQIFTENQLFHLAQPTLTHTGFTASQSQISTHLNTPTYSHLTSPCKAHLCSTPLAPPHCHTWNDDRSSLPTTHRTRTGPQTRGAPGTPDSGAQSPDPRASRDPKFPSANPQTVGHPDPRPAGRLGPQTPERRTRTRELPGPQAHGPPGTPDSQTQTPKRRATGTLDPRGSRDPRLPGANPQTCRRSGPQTPKQRPPTSSPQRTPPPNS